MGTPEYMVEMITGHAARVAVTMCLTRLNIDEARIMALERWGSDTMRAYARRAHLWAIQEIPLEAAQAAEASATRWSNDAAHNAFWADWSTGASARRGGGPSRMGPLRFTATCSAQVDDGEVVSIRELPAQGGADPAPQAAEEESLAEGTENCVICCGVIEPNDPYDHCGKCWRNVHKWMAGEDARNQVIPLRRFCAHPCGFRRWFERYRAWQFGCESFSATLARSGIFVRIEGKSRHFYTTRSDRGCGSDRLAPRARPHRPPPRAQGSGGVVPPETPWDWQHGPPGDAGGRGGASVVDRPPNGGQSFAGVAPVAVPCAGSEDEHAEAAMGDTGGPPPPFSPREELRVRARKPTCT